MATGELRISQDSWLELMNIEEGVFSPVDRFMGSEDYRDVIDHMRLVDGTPWTIPITLDIPQDHLRSIDTCSLLLLKDAHGTIVGELAVDEIFQVDQSRDVEKLFGTLDSSHPGVQKELARSVYRVSGKVRLLEALKDFFPDHHVSPKDTKRTMAERGWKTMTGFQTRNPVHRAHEYLQRIALEITDGIFIQPLIGWKKTGDFTPSAIIAAYQTQIQTFYPLERILFGTLRTPMRYAGPREAVFHAIIRRNYGCTHFIVGRDHAGVGGFYGQYEAQQLCRQFDNLGIVILPFSGPFYCKKCGSVVTKRTCGCGPEFNVGISGTLIRQMLSQGERPPPELMRKEIVDTLLNLGRSGSLFCP